MKNWEIEKNKLTKEFEFENFTDALVFVNKVGELAEEQNHHPDILVHDYKFVTISTTTHDAGKITKKDHKLSESIDKLQD